MEPNDARRDFGHIFQRGNVWWIRYSVDGRRYRESSHSTNPVKAEKLLSIREAELARGLFIAPDVKRTTFEDLARIAEDDYKVNKRRSLVRLQQSLANLRGVFGKNRAASITADRLTGYVVERTDQGAALSTVRNELNALRKAMKLARRAGRLAQVPDFPTLTLDNTRTGFFEAEDLDAVIAELPDYLGKFIRFLSLTGWRADEARTLTWAAVDFEHGVIRIEGTETKTKVARTFPFAVLPPLKTLLEEQCATTRAVERETGELVRWVFHRRGHPIGDYAKTWKAAVDRAAHAGSGPMRQLVRPQLVGRIVHDLRRTAVRNLERAGVPRSVAMKLTGHKTESVYQRYAIVNEADLSEGVEKLARLGQRGTKGAQSGHRGRSRRRSGGAA
jgi:integrase